MHMRIIQVAGLPSTWIMDANNSPQNNLTIQQMVAHIATHIVRCREFTPSNRYSTTHKLIAITYY